MKANELVIDKQVSMLLKAPWGFGKTLAAASFAVEGPVYMAYFDKKKPIELDHFFRRIIKRPELLENIEYDIYGAANANEYLNHVIRTAKDCRYFAYITDSVTNVTSAAVNWSLSFRDDRKHKDKLKVIPDWDEYKVETSLITQSLDLFRTMPCHIIFTCHPVPSVKIEGSGSSVKVSKTNPIVTYGSKVAGIVPGNFSEIYHFSKLASWDANSGRSNIKYLVDTDVTGDDFAKSNLGLKGQMDITDRLFYEVWKERVKELQKEREDDLKQQAETNVVSINPFDKTNQQKQWRT
jgi:hypothetical protein